MEGDMKDIVLTRLEKRLKDKDLEIRSLKSRLHESQPEDFKAKVKELEEKVEHLEGEVLETRTTLSEVMKKVGALESAINGLMIAAASDSENVEEISDPDLAFDGIQSPQVLPIYDKYIAANAEPPGLLPGEEVEKSRPSEKTSNSAKDALRFFHISKNS